MNISKAINILTVSMLCFLLFACNSETYEIDTILDSTPSIINLKAGDIVSVEIDKSTRSTNLDAAVNNLVSGQELGLFVMTERDYQSLLAGTPVINRYYGYDNIKGIIRGNGEIDIPDTVLYYPINKEEKCAIVAYLPYNKNASKALISGGEMFSLNTNQYFDSSVRENDILVGAPSTGNPIGQTEESETVNLMFSHRFTQVILDIDIPVTPSKICQNIVVTMLNVSSSAKVNILSGETIVNQDDVDEIVLADMPGIEDSELATTVNRKCSAIVFPQKHDTEIPPTFRIEFIDESGNVLNIYDFTDYTRTEYQTGNIVRYHISVPQDYYFIDALSSDQSLGSVNGGGMIPAGSSTELHASTIGDAVFVGWYSDNNLISTNNPYIILILFYAKYFIYRFVQR